MITSLLHDWEDYKRGRAYFVLHCKSIYFQFEFTANSDPRWNRSDMHGLNFKLTSSFDW